MSSEMPASSALTRWRTRRRTWLGKSREHAQLTTVFALPKLRPARGGLKTAAPKRPGMQISAEVTLDTVHRPRSANTYVLKGNIQTVAGKLPFIRRRTQYQSPAIIGVNHEK
jgi:hypothetical protein